MYLVFLVNECSVYGRGRNLEKAVEMLNTACSLGLSLDEKAYMNMITFYGKAGKFISLVKKSGFLIVKDIMSAKFLDECIFQTPKRLGCSPKLSPHHIFLVIKSNMGA